LIQFGRSIRWFNNYETEIQFSIDNGFDFHQIWYKEGKIVLDNVPEPKEEIIKNCGFPAIFHALFDINDFDEYLPRLIEILKYLSHKEVIIHPVCHSEEIGSHSIFKLCDNVSYASKMLGRNGIKLVLENNSKLDPIHYKVNEIRLMFERNPEI
jgi:hypothetical protein